MHIYIYTTFKGDVLSLRFEEAWSDWGRRTNLARLLDSFVTWFQHHSVTHTHKWKIEEEISGSHPPFPCWTAAR